MSLSNFISYKHYSPEERERWIRSVYPESENQKWHLNKVYHPSDIFHGEFFKQTSISKEYISPEKICGIEYGYSYNCPMHGKKTIDWKYMLHWLKRLDWVINNFETADKIINHIHNNNEPKTVHQYGNHYFTVGGQHRLCLAKYLDVKEVLVEVYKFELDRPLFVRERKFERYLPKLKDLGMIGKSFENEKHHHSVNLTINGNDFWVKKEFIEFIINRYKVLMANPFKAFRNSLKTLFKEHTNLIQKEADLAYLDSYLRRHRNR